MKYVLVSGGVVSGLGKGVTASSIGVLLKNCGFRVTSIKIGALISQAFQRIVIQFSAPARVPGNDPAPPPQIRT